MKTCKSPWSCPSCAHRLWLERTDALERALTRWNQRDGSVLFVTLTMRHDQALTLARAFDSVAKAWDAANSRRPVVSARTACGHACTLRRWDVTWGPVNGWHVHVHALLFFEGHISPDDQRRVAKAMFAAWKDKLVALKHPAPSEDLGGLHYKLLDLDQTRREAGEYIAGDRAVVRTREEAADARRRLAMEGAGDGGGKLAGAANYTTWQVLAAAMGGETWAQERWTEWEKASRGRRQLEPGRSDLMRALLAEDADALAEAEAPIPLVVFTPIQWQDVARKRMAVPLLEAAESGFRRGGVTEARRSALAVLAEAKIGGDWEPPPKREPPPPEQLTLSGSFDLLATVVG